VNWFLLAQVDPVAPIGPDLPSLWRTLGALLVVLGLLGAFAWLLRRQQAIRRTGRGMGVESAISLGDRRSLAIVTVEGRRLLLGLAPNAVSLVTELDPLPTFDQAMTDATTTEPRP
jgi:flagellar protein FliO/FliZ